MLIYIYFLFIYSHALRCFARSFAYACHAAPAHVCQMPLDVFMPTTRCRHTYVICVTRVDAATRRATPLRYMALRYC